MVCIVSKNANIASVFLPEMSFSKTLTYFIYFYFFYFKCQLCDKTFINSTFLQNHMQRRHPEEYEIRK